MNGVIKLYIYKIILIQNWKQFNVLYNKINKKNYKFDKYKGFKDFFNLKQKESINFGFESLNDNFDTFYYNIENYKNKGFNRKINNSEIVENSDTFIDNFKILLFFYQN